MVSKKDAEVEAELFEDMLDPPKPTRPGKKHKKGKK